MSLLERLQRPEILLTPGASNAITARLIEEIGFEAVYVTGAGFANAAYGIPDLGLIGLSEVVEHVHRIADTVEIPLIVDADTGYGGVLNVHRTVKQLEHAGAAAIQIEDQVTPKRCGHFDGTLVVPAADMISKIHAAVDARNDEQVVIVVRTDALRTEGVEQTIERAHLYAEAGASAIFVEAARTLEQLERLPREIPVPLVANMVEGGRTPLLSASELEQLGYRAVLFANTSLRAALLAESYVLRRLREDGTTAGVLDHLLSWDDRQELVGLPQMEALEAKFLGHAE